MKSVIVEIRGKYAAALSEDGSITKVRNHGYQVGQQIETVVPSHVNAQRIMALAACIALLLITGLGAYMYFTPYSYVSLDINPSVEFTLNRFDCVLSVEGVNDDGQALVENIDPAKLRNRPIDYAVVQTVNEISKHGYLEFPGISGIVIATSASDTVKAEKLAAELKAAVEHELLYGSDSRQDGSGSQDSGSLPKGGNESSDESGSNNGTGSNTEPPSELTPTPSHYGNDPNGNKGSSPKEGKHGKSKVIIESFNVGKEVVKKAKEIGVTPGKLQLVEKLQESAKAVEDIDIESWLDKPVREIMKATRKYQGEQPDDDDKSVSDGFDSGKGNDKGKKGDAAGNAGNTKNERNNNNQNPAGKSDKDTKPDKPGKSDKDTKPEKTGKPEKSDNGKNSSNNQNKGKAQQTNSKSDDDSHDRNTGKNEPQKDKDKDRKDPVGKGNGKSNEKNSPAGDRSEKSPPGKDSQKDRNNIGRKDQDPKNASKGNIPSRFR